MPKTETLTKSKPRDLQVGFYHPSPRFLRMREHIAVLDANSPLGGDDGELVALFGPSDVGLLSTGSGLRETVQTEISKRDAQRFAAAEDMEAALELLLGAVVELEELQKRHSRDVGLQQELSARIETARSALRKAKGEGANPHA